MPSFAQFAFDEPRVLIVTMHGSLKWRPWASCEATWEQVVLCGTILKASGELWKCLYHLPGTAPCVWESLGPGSVELEFMGEDSHRSFNRHSTGKGRIVCVGGRGQVGYRPLCPPHYRMTPSAVPGCSVLPVPCFLQSRVGRFGG